MSASPAWPQDVVHLEHMMRRGRDRAKAPGLSAPRRRRIPSRGPRAGDQVELPGGCFAQFAHPLYTAPAFVRCSPMSRDAAREYAMHRLALCALALMSTACEPLYTSWEGEDPAFLMAAAVIETPQASPSTLEVMSWNLKYGGGRINFWFDYWGDRALMTEAEADANIRGLIDLINEVDPDVLLAQEIERNSKRTAYRNMVQMVLDETPLNYAAYIPACRLACRNAGARSRDRGHGPVTADHEVVRMGGRSNRPRRVDESLLSASRIVHRSISGMLWSMSSTSTPPPTTTTAPTGATSIDKQLVDRLDDEGRELLVGGDFPTRFRRGRFVPRGLTTRSLSPMTPISRAHRINSTPCSLLRSLRRTCRLRPMGPPMKGQSRWYTHTVAPRSMPAAAAEPKTSTTCLRTPACRRGR